MWDIPRNLRRYGLRRFAQFALGELYALLWKRPVLHSYSQSGEDLILDKLLGYKRRGFYVDIGAYDPYRFSNTMRFYRRGWKGINIEPSVIHWKRFITARPRDNNLNIGIANTKGSLKYIVMDPPTLSTFSEKQANQYVKDGYTVVKKVFIRVMPLRDVLRKHSGAIDFLSLDVEGFEMDVLKSNDWEKYRPRVLCIETAHKNVNTYLTKQGYRLVKDNGLNSLYQNERST